MQSGTPLKLLQFSVGDKPGPPFCTKWINFFFTFLKENTLKIDKRVWVCLVEAGGNFSVQNGNPLELLQFSVGD